MNIYIKWFVIVGFNTIFSLIFASDFMKTIPGALGIIAGIICFVFIFIRLEIYLLKSKRKEWRKALIIAALVTGLLSLHPMIPMISGSLALDVTASLFHLQSSGFQHEGFFSVYLTTILTGLFLSLVVLVLAILLRFLFFKFPKFANTDADND